MDEPRNIGRAVVTVDCDTSAALRKLDELEQRAREAREAIPADETLASSDVIQALRRFVVRIADKENPTPAELDAMARIGTV